jgi:hypothetical protein
MMKNRRGTQPALQSAADANPVRLRPSDGLHGNNQIGGEAQDVLWKLEERKVRIADHPPRT